MFDSGMLAGDVIMILVTECASSRIPYDVWIQLACVLAGSWVLVSLLKASLREACRHPFPDRFMRPILTSYFACLPRHVRRGGSRLRDVLNGTCVAGRLHALVRRGLGGLDARLHAGF